MVSMASSTVASQQPSLTISDPPPDGSTTKNMSAPRIFSPQPLAVGSTVDITGKAGRHISRVLRLRADDAVILFDGSGFDFQATIVSIRKDEVSLSIIDTTKITNESRLRVTLWPGLSRSARMDNLLQKATELGVSGIAPVFTQRGVVRLDSSRADKRLEHWREVAVSACEQSGRSVVPTIEPACSLTERLQNLPVDCSPVMLLPGGPQKLCDVIQPEQPVILLSGPEGGLTEEESELAKEAGFRATGLGPRVLRTETAPVAALSILQYHFGDLGL
jgi:16S rRNA (uracil1498-N3)-methyltransferase